LRHSVYILHKVSKELATENAENFRRLQPHCRLTPLLVLKQPLRISAYIPYISRN